MASDEQQFYQLLENLMSLDNTTRQETEVCILSLRTQAECSFQPD
jgi:hypothetical protein